jgi:anti-sigma factor RsiW
MPDCDQVRLLLGPFDDGELEPHEMEEVALHVVTCPACKTALEQYRSLGVALRDCVVQPSIAGFTNAVLMRIEHLPRPLRVRVSRRLDAIAEHISAGMALIAAGAFATIATVLIMSPFARSLFAHQSAPPGQIALAPSSGSGAPFVPTPRQPVDFGPGQWSSSPGAEVQDVPVTDDSPTITVSDDPGTTVIWVPDQP